MKPKNKYLGPIVWIIQMHWQASKLALIWVGFRTVFDGVVKIATAYAAAQGLASVSAVAFQKGDAGTVYFWIFMVLLIAVIDFFVREIDSIVRMRSSDKVSVAINEHFFNKMYSLSQEQFEDQEFNTKLDRAKNGLYRLSGALNTVSHFLSSVIGLVGAMSVVILTAPLMGIIIFAATIPVIIVNKKISENMNEVYKKTEPYDRAGSKIRWILIDSLYMSEIRMMQAFKDMIWYWKMNTKKSDDIYFSLSKKNAKPSIIAGSINLFVNAGNNIYLFNLLLGGVIGFDKFIFLRSMFEQAQQSVDAIANIAKDFIENKIALDNYSEIHSTQPALPIGKVSPDAPLTIEFQDVSFKYPGSKKLVLKNISFVIKPGEKLALVGENGAGKTTIVKLMLRQYLPTSGNILVNGVDISDIDADAYYKMISSLGQEFYFVPSLTIKASMTLGLGKTLTDEKIYKITDMVDATGFLKKLPHGLESRLDPSFDDGTNLSGGQKQRLGIARTLIRNGDIMILDEPTSAIDAKAEYLIFNNIFDYHQGRTTLIISHRFSTVRRASNILVIEQGQITERGSHEELLAIDGTYKDMFTKQAEGYK